FPHAATPAIATGDKRVDDWWRTAVVYQVYIRSFSDGNGDGIGDLAGLRAEAHAAGIRVIADVVPNHVSSEHVWFRAALRDEPGARDRFIFRPGRGADGAQPPNDWVSAFGGPAWTRLPDGQWYLHLFAPAQPDLNWEHPEVRAEFEDVLRFWFDRGVDGFRVDVAHGLAKDPELPDAGERLPG